MTVAATTPTNHPLPPPPMKGPPSGEGLCTECGGRIRPDVAHGDQVCERCGLVAEEGLIDHGPEWRAFDGEAGNSRVGAPLTPLLPDRGLSTVIGGADRDPSGRRLTEGQRALARRVRRWHVRTRSNRERSLSVGLIEVARICGALDLPPRVKERAAHIYRQAHAADLVRGRTVASLAGASVFAACRALGHLRPLKEMEPVLQCSRREVARAHALLAHRLRLEAPPEGPADHLPRLATGLGLPPHVEQRARALLADPRAVALATSGKTAAGLAAAATYAAARMERVPCTQAALAQAARVTEVTLRTRCKELLVRLGLELPPMP